MELTKYQILLIAIFVVGIIVAITSFTQKGKMATAGQMLGIASIVFSVVTWWLYY
jgi:hypothetical protein